MSRKGPRRTGARSASPARSAAAARPAPTARRSRARPGRAGLLGRSLLALLLLGGVLLLARRPWRARPAPDPLAGTSFAAAAGAADSLDGRGRFLEALPFIRHMLRLRPANALYESRIATTLNNAAIEVREKDGLAIPATRSSVERVALVRESLSRSSHAEEAAPAQEFRGAEIASRAGQLSSWGFQREAFAEFCRASGISTLDGRTASEARWVEAMLRDPRTTPSPAASLDPAAAPADSSAGRSLRPRGAAR